MKEFIVQAAFRLIALIPDVCIKNITSCIIVCFMIIRNVPLVQENVPARCSSRALGAEVFSLELI